MTWPNFLLIGAAKAGTTALFEALRTHPQIFMPRNKEPATFAWAGAPVPDSGPGDRAALAPYTLTDWAAYQALFAGSEGFAARGEASTAYLYHPQAAARISERLPEVKLIAVLRQPADRAYAAYRHLLRDGRERLAFADALDAEAQRVAAGWEPLWHYRAMGRYGEQLARYRQRFSAEQLHVILYDQWRTEPATVLAGICRFLKIDPDRCPAPAPSDRPAGLPRHPRLYALFGRPGRGRAAVRRLLPAAARERISRRLRRWPVNPAPLDPALRLALTESYREDLDRLAALTGLDLAHWRVPSHADPVSS